MPNIQKLIGRFLCVPADFKYNELIRLLNHYGYVKVKKGKSGGSRRGFYNDTLDNIITVHEPHPKSKPIPRTDLRYVQKHLAKVGLLIPKTK